MVYRSLPRAGAHWPRALRGKLEFEDSTAVLVELTTQETIDAEPDS